jgi:hypothetical protein
VPARSATSSWVSSSSYRRSGCERRFSSCRAALEPLRTRRAPHDDPEGGRRAHCSDRRSNRCSCCGYRRPAHGAPRRDQNKTARDALEASTLPFVTSVPRGLYREERGDGPADRKWSDLSRVSVSTPSDGNRSLFAASVPIRNVGSGLARTDGVQFHVGGETIGATPWNVVLPSGELTRVGFTVDEDHPDIRAAEAIAIEYEDFSVTIAYSDASGRPRGTARLEVSNGEHPFVSVRT